MSATTNIKELMEIIIEISALLADDSDYEKNISPKLQKVLDYLKEKTNEL